MNFRKTFNSLKKYFKLLTYIGKYYIVNLKIIKLALCSCPKFNYNKNNLNTVKISLNINLRSLGLQFTKITFSEDI